MSNMTISIKTEAEIEKMRIAGRLASQVLDMIGRYTIGGKVLFHPSATPLSP